MGESPSPAPHGAESPFSVEDEVIVELKAVETPPRIYEAQVLTYLRAWDKRVGLLINFKVVRLKDGSKRLIL